MNSFEAALLLSSFEIHATPVDNYWFVRIPWATGTPLATGETVTEGEVVALAEAVVDTYSRPERRECFRTDLMRYLMAESAI